MTITKVTIEIEEPQFKEEIRQICETISRFNRSQIGAKFAVFKRELGLKITELQFFELCERCGIEVRRNLIYFDQFQQT